jgi:hypothetical protein
MAPAAPLKNDFLTNVNAVLGTEMGCKSAFPLVSRSLAARLSFGKLAYWICALSRKSVYQARGLQTFMGGWGHFARFALYNRPPMRGVADI